MKKILYYIAFQNLVTKEISIIEELGELEKKPKKSDLPFDTKTKKHFILKIKVVWNE